MLVLNLYIEIPAEALCEGTDSVGRKTAGWGWLKRHGRYRIRRTHPAKVYERAHRSAKLIQSPVLTFLQFQID